MDDVTTATGSEEVHAVGETDVVVDLEHLAGLYRARAAGRSAVPQRELPMLERSLRKHVAEALLAHVVPALLGELLEATVDDLRPAGPEDALSDLEASSDAELRVVESVERCKAVMDAAGLEALARLHSTIESSELARSAALTAADRPDRSVSSARRRGWIDADELTAMEVCTATGLGQHEVRLRVDLALSRTPGASELRRRLQQGSVSLYRACTIFAEIAALPAECGAGIVDTVLRTKDGAPPSPGLFRQRLTRACLAADREAAESRRAARRRRGAHAQIDRSGLGTLTVVNDADKIVAAIERAEAVARAARAAGDPRDLDSLCADVITDTLMFGWPTPDARPPSERCGSGSSSPVGPTRRGTADEPTGRDEPGDRSTGCGSWSTDLGRRPAAHVTLVVPFTTAIGLTDAPCELVGHGWVTAAHARQIMLNDDSVWRRLAVDAESGAALHLQTHAYRPTAAMRAHVEAVDGTCRAPGCTVPAARCDVDHDIPWPHGPTDVANLTSKHRPHHNLHTHGHWTVQRDGDRVRWRTKAGRVYDTYPKDWLEPLRDSWNARPPMTSSTGAATPRRSPAATSSTTAHAVERELSPPF